MAPDEVLQLNNKLDSAIEKLGKVYGAVGEVDKSVALVSQKFDDHLQRHEERDRVREATCPTGPKVEALKSDIDAVAGIVRDLQGSVVVLAETVERLEKANEAAQSEEKVTDAVWTERLRPLRWLWDNIGKVASVIVIAVMLSIVEYAKAWFKAHS